MSHMSLRGSKFFKFGLIQSVRQSSKGYVTSNSSSSPTFSSEFQSLSLAVISSTSLRLTTRTYVINTSVGHSFTIGTGSDDSFLSISVNQLLVSRICIEIIDISMEGNTEHEHVVLGKRRRMFWR